MSNLRLVKFGWPLVVNFWLVVKQLWLFELVNLRLVIDWLVLLVLVVQTRLFKEALLTS